jgi:hypothetical protein
VIRGPRRGRATLDGRGCDDCNVLEIYGGHTYVERLTIRNGLRGFKFQGERSPGNVVRGNRIERVTLGIGTKTTQLDAYVCDNVVEGRLRWPHVYTDDGGRHSSDEGIVVWGEGHVVCRNRVRGFGDAINVGPGERATDIYGNDVRASYDNGIELDHGHGNLRVFGNRVSNAFAPLSAQPVTGGPGYFVRNVVVNVADEQVKTKAVSVGGGFHEPSGVLVLHNTFVSGRTALLLQTPITVHHTRFANNVFVGPRGAASVAEWTARTDDVTFDHNGWWPDGRFRIGGVRADSLAALQRRGVERGGVLLDGGTFARTRPLRGYRRAVGPTLPELSATSRAIDRGTPIPGLSDTFSGAAPDLGALERGAPRPRYGPR